MSDAIGRDLAGKLLRIANLDAETRFKLAQRVFLPWQFMLSAIAIAFTAGADLAAGVFTLLHWKMRDNPCGVAGHPGHAALVAA